MEKLSDNTEIGFDEIKTNLRKIRGNVARAAAEAGRTDKVRIMAVTKTVSADKVNFAIDMGVDLLGENRVQEYMEKRDSYKPCETHFIGTLQTNKVKYIIDKVSMIHSVDNIRLIEEIDRRALQHGLVMDVLAEINIGGEESKSGVSAQSAEEFCEQIGRFRGVRLRGLMTIPPPGCPESVFACMQDIYLKLQASERKRGNSEFDTLSMGMSADYETAVKYGSTIIRIGSGLFGYRKYVTK